MHFQNLLTANDVRQAHHHLAIEPARAQQRRVQHVRTVGGGNDDNAFIAFEAVHFHQQLVEGLLTLVVTTAHTSTTVTANRIDLINEDNARALFFRLLEHVANTGGTHAHKHFHKVGAGDREERHLGLARDGLGKQGFTGTGRAHHQYALRDATTKALELARIPEEIHQLFHVFLGFVDTRDIGKRGFDLVFTHQARLALAERHGAFAATAALHLAHEEHEQCNDDQNRERGYQQLRPQALALGLLADHFDVVGEQVIHQLVVRHLRPDALELGAVVADTLHLQTVNGHLPYLALLDHLDKLGIVNLLAGGGGREILKHHQQHGGYD